MSTLDRTGRECHGNVPVEALDAHCDAEDRETLAAMIRSHMRPERGASSALARKCGVTPACIGDILHARKSVSPALLERIGCTLGAADATIDHWRALAGHIPPDITAVLLAHPERWDAVRALLTGGSR